MYKIEVEEIIDMPLQEAFRMLTDHANYKLYPGINGSMLLKKGETETNGFGAIREIKVPGTTLQEQIIKFEHNKIMEYRIIQAKPIGMYHPLGRMEFEAVDDDKTKINWTSEFGIKFPLIGQMLDNYVGPRFAESFSTLLHGVAKRYKFFSK